MYLRGAQTIPDAVENLRKGIALGGLEMFHSNPTLVQDVRKPAVPFMLMKENKGQSSTTDTLRAVKETIQDSMNNNNKIIGGIIDEIGDRLANIVDVVDVVETSSRYRDRNRDRTPSRSRNNLRDKYRNKSGSRDRYDSRDNYKDRDRNKPSSRNERNGRRKH